MWPALIFAASRKHKVIGRNKILIVSMKIRGIASHSGAPNGSKEAITFLKDGKEERIKHNHNGSPIGRVTIRWDVGLKEYGSIDPRFTTVNQINKANIKLGSIFIFTARVWDDWLRATEIAVDWAARIFTIRGNAGRSSKVIGRKAASQ